MDNNKIHNSKIHNNKINNNKVNNKIQMQSFVTDIAVKSILDNWGYENPILIGKGAFSHVYRVRERETGRFFACKISQEQEMLQRESLLLQQINHPLFPKCYHLKQQDKTAFLFMEYIPGVNLGTLVARRGRMSQRQAVNVGVALAEGLCYLHERSKPIVFRDVKPENIMIREDGSVKLLDLGSAGEVDSAIHIITGTQGYAAPEQWEKEGKVGGYSDVYAVGKVMYYMLTGSQNDIRNDRTKRIQMSNRKMCWGIKQVIEACVRREAQERIPDMRCLLNKLKPYHTAPKWKILCLELKALLGRKHKAEYIFQQNVLKSSEK